MDNAMPSPKYQTESAITKRLLSILNQDNYILRDPNSAGRSETGIDVELIAPDSDDARAIGVQVTEFHSDEGTTNRGGSRLRSEAMRAPNLPMWVPTNYLPALKARITAKVDLADKYNFSHLRSVWLVIAASVPKPGALQPTFIFPPFIQEKLDFELHNLLIRSKYGAVFLYIMTPPCVFEWVRDCGWKMVYGASDLPQPDRR